LLFTINTAIENKYCETKGKTCKFLKNATHEALGLAFIIILIILFCSLNILVLEVESPQKIGPYVEME
jgi:hypothetical protein